MSPDLDNESHSKKDEINQNFPNSTKAEISDSEDTTETSKPLLITHLHKIIEKITFHWKSDRSKIIKILSLGIGTILIISGIFYLTGSPEKVADNVVLNERSVISAFLIIFGVMLYTGSLAQRIISKTSFKNIYKEVKKVEKKPPSTDNNESKKDQK